MDRPQHATTEVADCHAHLRNTVADLQSTIVAYSGGVDSALVAAVANDVLGPERCLVAIAVSPSLADYELQSALSLANEQGWRLEQVRTTEFEDPRYIANAGDRCFFCKTELYTILTQLARARGYNTVANGANLDDRGDYRPGMTAAVDFGVRSPLLECGIGKPMVRALAQRYGLPNWDKPAQPCLSSRVPYGTSVTPDIVSMIGRAEGHLRSMGFTECRVRHYGDTARVEVPLAQVDSLRGVWFKVAPGILDAGYTSAEIEERGLKSGRLNESISGSKRVATQS